MGYYESRELVEAVKYLTNKYTINEISMLAFSMGSATSVLAARDIQQIKNSSGDIKVKALVLDSPYVSFRDIIQQQVQSKRFYNKYFIDLVLNYIGWRLKFNVDEVDLIKILNEPRDFSVFIIHGNNDDLVPQENGKRLFDTLTTKKEAWFPENVGHACILTQLSDSTVPPSGTSLRNSCGLATMFTLHCLMQVV